MAYSKHVWQSGETITDELLNRMEDGIAAADAKQGPKGDPGKNGLSIKSIVINVKGSAVSGEATLSDGETKVPITGTYSAT